MMMRPYEPRDSARLCIRVRFPLPLSNLGDENPVAMLTLLSATLTFSGSTPLATTRLHQSRAGPVAASLVDRRAMLGAAAAALAAVPAASFADKPAASDGKWAQHDQDEAFTDEDFAGFTKSPTGLEYKIVQEGYG